MWKSRVFLAAFLAISPLQSIAAELLELGAIEVPDKPPYDDDEDAFDQSHNMSGLFCPAADWCLMVADELQGIHRLDIDRNGAKPKLTYGAALRFEMPSNKFLKAHGMKKKDLSELDLEAVAASGNKIVLVGSHANKRNSGNFNAGSHLIAIADVTKLNHKTVAADWASLDPLFEREDLFPNALRKELQCGGINVEGATVAGNDLLIGLRSPSRTDSGTEPAAYVISTPLDDALKEDFSKAKLHVLPTEVPFIGVRALETVGDSVLIITGDAGVNDLKPRKPDDDPRTCTTNLNKEDQNRRFQLRVWKPANGDTLEPAVVWEFAPSEEIGADGNSVSAKVEAIAADPAQPGAFFVLYDGSATVRYLSGVDLR